ncbi:MAG: cellulose binding domain-containing protein [Saccharospirillaceae bacterium]|nr:cellulose-binding domain-containing protein [Pseudomonadales bacterium]NRB79383.1 cellulose binding domain-containing protein [Saccharospirillaceae bacterium]
MQKSALILLILLSISLNLMAKMAGPIDSAPVSDDLIQAPLFCEYVITNEWDKGFTGVVQISNLSDKEVDGWSIQWVLSKNNLSNTWNADIEILELELGAKQFRATNLPWNQIIKVDQTIEFGFQGDKLGAQIESVVLVGEKCRVLNLEK